MSLTLRGIELFDVCASSPALEVHVDFAGITIPITGAKAENGKIILDVGAMWQWRLEDPKGGTDQRRPQADPGEP